VGVVLAVLAVLAVAALVVYFLDQAMGWGIVAGAEASVRLVP
jgi:preprotein translocase subunit SecE